MNTLRGVNLGGWLVLERWMTPSLFGGTKARDEWSFMKTTDAANKIRRHREEFITEADFAWISEHGLNAIRLPVGYWIIHPDGPYVEGIRHVDWAFRMAEKYKLHILLDLHGVPESQNGHDHSGKSGEAGWYRSSTARERTVKILQELHERYEDSPSYWGLQLINEPKVKLFQRTLRKFYKVASRNIDGKQRIVFHDAFTPLLMSGALQRDKRAVMDIHLYHMTSVIAWLLSAKRYVNVVGWLYSVKIRIVRKVQPVVIGEWSIVLRGDKLKRMSVRDARDLMQRFGRIQMSTYETYSDGWFYWSYKTESPDIWNFKSLVEDGSLRIPR